VFVEPPPGTKFDRARSVQSALSCGQEKTLQEFPTIKKNKKKYRKRQSDCRLNDVQIFSMT